MSATFIRTGLPTPHRELELAEVLRIANSKLPALPHVERFELAPARDDADHRLFRTQIRAVPSGAAPGAVEFRYVMPLRESGKSRFQDIAWHLLGAADSFRTDPACAELGERVRAMVVPMLLAAPPSREPIRLTAVTLCFDELDHDPPLGADLGMLGADLRVGTERVTASLIDGVQRQVARAIESHGRREQARARAEAEGVSGWLTRTALRIVDAAGVDRGEAIALTRADGYVGLTFADGGGRGFGAELQVCDGVVDGWVMPQDRDWSLKRGGLTFWAEGMPEALTASLIGRRVGAVFDSPILPEDAVVRSVEEVDLVDPDDPNDDEHNSGWLRLHLDVPLLGIDALTGDVREGWPANGEVEDVG